MSQAHTAELNSALGTSQALFRRQLEGLRERLQASNARADGYSLSLFKDSEAPIDTITKYEYWCTSPSSWQCTVPREIKKTFEARRIKARQMGNY